MTNRKQTILVTGASGYVGSAIVRALVDRYDVVALDHTAPAIPAANAEFVVVDVTSDTSVKAALDRVRIAHGSKIASVIHLAAYFDLTGEPNPKYESVTVGGTRRIVKALEAFETEQFIFMSTLLVQAPSGHGQQINEDSPLQDALPYPASKLRTERLLQKERGDVPIVVLRAAGVYDELCHAAFLDHQIARIYERRLASHVYPGDLTAGQPYLHLADLIAAIELAIERRADLHPDSTFLLGEDDVMGFDEIQQAVGQGLHGHPWPTVRIPASAAEAGAWMEDKVLQEEPFIRPWMVRIASDHYEIDTRRARTQLGWGPTRTLRETLPVMLDSLKHDPVGWYTANHLDAALIADRQTPDAAESGSQGTAEVGGESHEEMTLQMRESHFEMLWVHWLNILLGAWLVASPFAFGSFGTNEFTAAVRHVTLDRHLADPALRSQWMGYSDLVSGMLVMLFGAMSLSTRLSWAQWANACTGVWLLFAPLIFWSPGAAAYTNDTFVGALVIAFAVLVPMMPGMSMSGMMDKSDRPVGWTYSPSTYLQRLPIIALGAFGFLVSRSLTAYQLGHIGGVWEPFFVGARGLNGTETIITSSVSKAWPVADAGLGAVAYVFEVLMGVMGDSRRWRTMPWMVAMFGIVVVPLGVVSITFVVIQPIVIGTWCTLCLVTAAAMLAMIPLSFDELVAMGQYLVQSHRRGEPFWPTFLRGGAQPQDDRDTSPGFDAKLSKAAGSAVRGVTVPWTLALSAVIGVSLMLTRVLLQTMPPLANSDHLVGAMIVTFAVMAMAEVGRMLRFANIGFGLWLMAAPWLIHGDRATAACIESLLGFTVVLLSLPRGQRSTEHYGSWDRYLQ